MKRMLNIERVSSVTGRMRSLTAATTTFTTTTP